MAGIVDAAMKGNDGLVRTAQIRAAYAGDTAKLAAGASNGTQIDEAAKQFESVFISEMLKPMFEEVNKADPMFGGGKGEEVFNGMMVDQYGKMLSERGGIGIAGRVKAELLRLQEAKNNGKV